MASPVLWNDVETESLVDCVGSFPHAGLQLEALRVCDLGIPLVVWYHTESPEEKLFKIYIENHAGIKFPRLRREIVSTPEKK